MAHNGYQQATQQHYNNAQQPVPRQPNGQPTSRLDGYPNGATYDASNEPPRQRGNSYGQYGGNPYASEDAALGAYGGREAGPNNYRQEQSGYERYGEGARQGEGWSSQSTAQQRPPPDRQRNGPPMGPPNAMGGAYPRPMNRPPENWQARLPGVPPNVRGAGYGPSSRGASHYGRPPPSDRGRPPMSGPGQQFAGPGYNQASQGGQYWDRPGASQTRSQSGPGRSPPEQQGYPGQGAYVEGYRPRPQPRSHSRPGRGPPPNGAPGPMYAPQAIPAEGYRPPPPRSQSRPRQGPPGANQDPNRYPNGPPQRQSPPSLRDDYRPGSQPQNEQTSPKARNFDNPFPVFPSGNPPPLPAPDDSQNAPRRPNGARQSQEIYDGIVADYAGDDNAQANGRAEGQRPYDELTQVQQRNFPLRGPGPQNQTTSERPPMHDRQRPSNGSLPGPQKLPLPNEIGPNGAQSWQNGRNMHGQFMGNGVSGPRPGTAPSAPAGPNNQDLGRTDYGAGNAVPGPFPDRSAPQNQPYAGPDSRNRGPPRPLDGAGSRRPPERFAEGPQPPSMTAWQRSDDRANSLPGRAIGGDPRNALQMRQEGVPHNGYPAFHEARASEPNARPIAAHIGQRPQSPFGRQDYNNASGDPAGLPVASSGPNAYDVDAGQGRPSFDYSNSSTTIPLHSKRSHGNLPNRSNIQRPNFYQATGQLPHSPPQTFAQPVPPPAAGPGSIGSAAAQQAPPLATTNPDALPHHATPVQPGTQQSSAVSNQTNRPPPVRQYNSNSDSAKATLAGPAAPKAMPVTQEELSRLREAVRKNPADNGAHLALAKKLAEASTTLAGENGRADARTRDRNRQAYNAEAFKLVKKLVSTGYGDAMFYLAECYGDGSLGLQVEAKEAFSLYQAAAKQGHAAAAYRTAVCCEIGPEEGGGTRKDLQKSFQWYKRASALGDVPATYKMGVILLKGLLGQEKNLGEAVAYLKRAAERADAENPHALHELGLLYESTRNPGIIVRDEPQALQLFTRAAKLGYKFSQFKLGQAYEYGLLGCNVDARNSIIWYTKAAAQGEHQSELALSGWYLTGSEGILEHSDIEAYLWARKAALAEPPLPKAMFAMGYFTEVGIGCPRSVEEAKRWYGRAAAYKFPKAQEHLEELQRGGSKTQRNRETISRNQKKDADCMIM